MMKAFLKLFAFMILIGAFKKTACGIDLNEGPQPLLYRSFAYPERQRLRPEVRMREVLNSKFDFV